MAVLLIAIAVSISISMETVGVWGRVVGRLHNSPTTGYSLHVRTATAGRFFMIFTAPLLGYLIDRGALPSQIALCGAIAFALCFFYTFLILCANNIEIVGRIYSRKFPEAPSSRYSVNRTFNFHFSARAAASYFFTATGLIVVNLLAAYAPEHRATIVQASAFVTAFGTVLHVYIVDPQLAKAADSNYQEIYNLAYNFIAARCASSLMLALAFSTYYALDF